MGVLAIVGGVWLVVMLVSVPLFLSVASSFFPTLAPSRRTSGRIMDRGAAFLIALLCLLAYYMWWARFLPYIRAIDPRVSVHATHAVLAHVTWLGTVACWISACARSPCRLPRGTDPRSTCAACGSAQAGRDCHCRLCAACIGGFDHHCPFIAQCVGAHNRDSFFAFLVLASAGLVYAASVSFQPFFACIAFPVANLAFAWGSSRLRPDAACRLVQEHALLFLPTAGLCSLVVALAAWQAYLRAVGESTAEFVRRWRLLGPPKERRRLF